MRISKYCLTDEIRNMRTNDVLIIDEISKKKSNRVLTLKLKANSIYDVAFSI